MSTTTMSGPGAAGGGHATKGGPHQGANVTSSATPPTATTASSQNCLVPIVNMAGSAFLIRVPGQKDGGGGASASQYRAAPGNATPNPGDPLTTTASSRLLHEYYSSGQRSQGPGPRYPARLIMPGAPAPPARPGAANRSSARSRPKSRDSSVVSRKTLLSERGSCLRNRDEDPFVLSSTSSSDTETTSGSDPALSNCGPIGKMLYSKHVFSELQKVEGGQGAGDLGLAAGELQAREEGGGQGAASDEAGAGQGNLTAGGAVVGVGGAVQEPGGSRSAGPQDPSSSGASSKSKTGSAVSGQSMVRGEEDHTITVETANLNVADGLLNAESRSSTLVSRATSTLVSRATSDVFSRKNTIGSTASSTSSTALHVVANPGGAGALLPGDGELLLLGNHPHARIPPSIPALPKPAATPPQKDSRRGDHEDVGPASLSQSQPAVEVGGTRTGTGRSVTSGPSSGRATPGRGGPLSRRAPKKNTKVVEDAANWLKRSLQQEAELRSARRGGLDASQQTSQAVSSACDSGNDDENYPILGAALPRDSPEAAPRSANGGERGKQVGNPNHHRGLSVSSSHLHGSVSAGYLSSASSSVNTHASGTTRPRKSIIRKASRRNTLINKATPRVVVREWSPQSGPEEDGHDVAQQRVRNSSSSSSASGRGHDPSAGGPQPADHRTTNDKQGEEQPLQQNGDHPASTSMHNHRSTRSRASSTSARRSPDGADQQVDEDATRRLDRSYGLVAEYLEKLARTRSRSIPRSDASGLVAASSPREDFLNTSCSPGLAGEEGAGGPRAETAAKPEASRGPLAGADEAPAGAPEEMRGDEDAQVEFYPPEQDPFLHPDVLLLSNTLKNQTPRYHYDYATPSGGLMPNYLSVKQLKQEISKQFKIPVTLVMIMEVRGDEENLIEDDEAAVAFEASAGKSSSAADRLADIEVGELSKYDVHYRFLVRRVPFPSFEVDPLPQPQHPSTAGAPAVPAAGEPPLAGADHVEAEPSPEDRDRERDPDPPARTSTNARATPTPTPSPDAAGPRVELHSEEDDSQNDHPHDINATAHQNIDGLRPKSNAFFEEVNSLGLAACREFVYQEEYKNHPSYSPSFFYDVCMAQQTNLAIALAEYGDLELLSFVDGCTRTTAFMAACWVKTPIVAASRTAADEDENYIYPMEEDGDNGLGLGVDEVDAGELDVVAAEGRDAEDIRAEEAAAMGKVEVRIKKKGSTCSSLKMGSLLPVGGAGLFSSGKKTPSSSARRGEDQLEDEDDEDAYTTTTAGGGNYVPHSSSITPARSRTTTKGTIIGGVNPPNQTAGAACLAGAQTLLGCQTPTVVPHFVLDGPSAPEVQLLQRENQDEDQGNKSPGGRPGAATSETTAALTTSEQVDHHGRRRIISKDTLIPENRFPSSGVKAGGAKEKVRLGDDPSEADQDDWDSLDDDGWRNSKLLARLRKMSHSPKKLGRSGGAGGGFGGEEEEDGADVDAEVDDVGAENSTRAAIQGTAASGRRHASGPFASEKHPQHGKHGFSFSSSSAPASSAASATSSTSKQHPSVSRLTAKNLRSLITSTGGGILVEKEHHHRRASVASNDSKKHVHMALNAHFKDEVVEEVQEDGPAAALPEDENDDNAEDLLHQAAPLMPSPVNVGGPAPAVNLISSIKEKHQVSMQLNTRFLLPEDDDHTSTSEEEEEVENQQEAKKSSSTPSESDREANAPDGGMMKTGRTKDYDESRCRDGCSRAAGRSGGSRRKQATPHTGSASVEDQAAARLAGAPASEEEVAVAEKTESAPGRIIDLVQHRTRGQEQHGTQQNSSTETGADEGTTTMTPTSAARKVSDQSEDKSQLARRAKFPFFSPPLRPRGGHRSRPRSRVAGSPPSGPGSGYNSSSALTDTNLPSARSLRTAKASARHALTAEKRQLRGLKIAGLEEAAQGKRSVEDEAVAASRVHAPSKKTSATTSSRAASTPREKFSSACSSDDDDEIGNDGESKCDAELAPIDQQTTTEAATSAVCQTSASSSATSKEKPASARGTGEQVHVNVEDKNRNSPLVVPHQYQDPHVIGSEDLPAAAAAAPTTRSSNPASDSENHMRLVLSPESLRRLEAHQFHYSRYSTAQKDSSACSEYSTATYRNLDFNELLHPALSFIHRLQSLKEEADLAALANRFEEVLLPVNVEDKPHQQEHGADAAERIDGIEVLQKLVNRRNSRNQTCFTFAGDEEVALKLLSLAPEHATVNLVDRELHEAEAGEGEAESTTRAEDGNRAEKGANGGGKSALRAEGSNGSPDVVVGVVEQGGIEAADSSLDAAAAARTSPRPPDEDDQGATTFPDEGDAAPSEPQGWNLLSYACYRKYRRVLHELLRKRWIQDRSLFSQSTFFFAATNGWEQEVDLMQNYMSSLNQGQLQAQS